MRVQFHEQNVLFQILDHSAIMYQKSVSLELLVLKLVFFFSSYYFISLSYFFISYFQFQHATKSIEWNIQMNEHISGL